MDDISLFSEIDNKKSSLSRPLAYRMRPCSFDDFIGQENILGKDKLLRRMILNDCLQSVILWGPPGSGKNSLASLMAFLTKREFVSINAVESNTNALRKTAQNARYNLNHLNKRTLLFIDEIHRFNKAQQDLLLPYVEEGDLTLIGATTHNPVFSLITALRSRSHIFELKPLRKSDIRIILINALQSINKDKKDKVTVSDDVIDRIADRCGGDARIALNTLELSLQTYHKTAPITVDVIDECLPHAVVKYDKDESEHYDTISIFIKSMRGSDPDAAVFWLGKMLASGEDPLFIARRIAIFASEDIGMADPQALLIADSSMRLVAEIGMPEARIILSHAVIYMSTALKSNASFSAINAVLSDIESNGVEDIPDFIRKTPNKNNEKYLYSHNYKEGITGQDYRSEKKLYYNPKDTGYESVIRKRIGLWKKIKARNSSDRI
ncbi:MAG: replication-associated recombination protein A [Candidatus Aureabacteria bacterium]|nr:replication-associated recombination protein A [Candidatus Auribacterota bacterium]